ncbi:MAG TPA: hypothetical protein DD426_01985, partial [Clostridiaceae bacterium]|nr:hypothetical protein [Clostridiaceae bacterium]
SVLVTGCSSGMGRAISLFLARHGFLVFATVRKEKDFDSLKDMDEKNLVPVFPLDLTMQEHIPNVLETVKKELAARNIKGLYAVINNAGGGFIAPLELMDLEKFRTEIETRIVGPIALLQAFLPLIREAHGRILWIATPAIIPIPYVSSIHACDFAQNCLARTFQIELGPWKIPNILIRCGGMDTPSPAKNALELENSMKKWPKERLDLYRQALVKDQKSLSEFDKKRTDPEKAAETVFKALCAKNPKSRYQVGHLSKSAAFLEYLPQTMVDHIMAGR